MGSSHNWLRYLFEQVIFSHLWLNCLLHLIFILWCSTRFYSFHNLCLTHCFNCFLSRCKSTAVFLFIFLASLSSSHCSLQRCVSSLHSWFLHNGLIRNPTKTEAICFGTNSRLKSPSSLTFIEVALDNHFNFDRHISNVCSSSHFHIRALRHIRPYLDSETSMTIACAVVGSRLDYTN